MALYTSYSTTPALFVLLTIQKNINFDPLTQAWLCAWEGFLMYHGNFVKSEYQINGQKVHTHTPPTPPAPFKAICQDDAMTVGKIMLNNTSDSPGN